MEENILNTLFCSLCCLKFDTEVWYDLHLSLVHDHETETESIKMKTKSLPEIEEFPTNSSNIPKNYKEDQDLNTNSGSNNIQNIQNTQPQIIDYVPDDTTRSSMTTLEIMISDEPIPTTQASIFGKCIHIPHSHAFASIASIALKDWDPFFDALH